MGERAGRLRLRLTAIAALVLVAILALAAVAIVLLFQRSLQATTDDLSRTRARDVAAAVEGGVLSQVLVDVGDDSVAQVVAADGRVLAASANLGDSGPITSRRPEGHEPAAYDLKDVRDDNETEDYRVWAVTASGPDGPAVVYVGHSTEALVETVASLLGALALGLPLVLVLATALLWALIGRTLRPVEEAHRRQRAFVADAAHELQSPLAAYRTSIEVGLEHPETTNWPLTARGLLADSDRMEQLVRDLLFLADKMTGRRSIASSTSMTWCWKKPVDCAPVPAWRSTRRGSVRRRSPAHAPTWDGWCAICWPTRSSTRPPGSP